MAGSGTFKIGITGGLGSGKTTAARVLEQSGYPVYFADDRAKWLLQNHTALKEQLIALLGKEAYDGEGGLNRKLVAKRIFEDHLLLEKINRLVHPAVKDDFFSWVRVHAQHKYLFKEAAILLEAQTQEQLDFILLIYAPKTLRIRRAMARDDASYDQLIERINRQWSDKYKMQFVHYTIFNDGEHSLQQQIAKFLDYLEREYNANFTNCRSLDAQ